jgi:outer membrane murein-binding lipoprotein Lpp
MRNRILVAGWVIVSCVWAAGCGQAQTGSKPKETAKPSKATKLAAEAKALTEELKEARELVKRLPESATREKLELQIARAELRALGMKQEIDGLESVAPVAKVAMADAEFQKLLKTFKAESFDSGKAQVLPTVKGVSLNCEQLKAIMKAYDHDEGRVAAAAHFYPMLVDPEKAFDLAEVFTFDSGKKAFREAIGKLSK